MKEIDELIKKRDDYLKSNPHLQPLQDDLDLKMAGLAPIDRLAYLNVLMLQRFSNLKKAWEELAEVSEKQRSIRKGIAP